MSIGQCGDFYYLNVGADTSQYSIKQAQEAHEVSDWNGYGAIDTIAIEDTAYYMEGDGEYILYIYYLLFHTLLLLNYLNNLLIILNHLYCQFYLLYLVK